MRFNKILSLVAVALLAMAAEAQAIPTKSVDSDLVRDRAAPADPPLVIPHRTGVAGFPSTGHYVSRWSFVWVPSSGRFERRWRSIWVPGNPARM